MKNIKSRAIYPVKIWNTQKRADEQYMLIYTLNNGSMVDEPRKNGYVVQKYHNKGGEKSRFFLSHDRAMEYHLSDEF